MLLLVNCIYVAVVCAQFSALLVKRRRNGDRFPRFSGSPLVRKLNLFAQKRTDKPKKTWDEVLVDDRKKLEMDSAGPQNRSEWRGRLRGRLVKQT